MSEHDRSLRPRRSARLAGSELEPRLRPGGMAQQADRLRLGRAELAEGLVRPRTADRRCEAVVEEEMQRIGAVGVAKTGIRRLAAATLLAHGSASAEGEVPAPQPDRRGHLVPVVQRARQRVGPRRRHDAGRVQGQPLGDQRPEGLDHQRASCRLGVVAGAHRRRTCRSIRGCRTSCSTSASRASRCSRCGR